MQWIKAYEKDGYVVWFHRMLIKMYEPSGNKNESTSNAFVNGESTYEEWAAHLLKIWLKGERLPNALTVINTGEIPQVGEDHDVRPQERAGKTYQEGLKKPKVNEIGLYVNDLDDKAISIADLYDSIMQGFGEGVIKTTPGHITMDIICPTDPRTITISYYSDCDGK